MSCETCDTPGEPMCATCADVAREDAKRADEHYDAAMTMGEKHRRNWAEACSEREALRAENATLRAALEPFAESRLDLTDAPCHAGITTADACARCSKAFAARAALADKDGK